MDCAERVDYAERVDCAERGRRLRLKVIYPMNLCSREPRNVKFALVDGDAQARSRLRTTGEAAGPLRSNNYPTTRPVVSDDCSVPVLRRGRV